MSQSQSYGRGDLTHGGYSSDQQYTTSYQNDSSQSAAKDFPRLTKLVGSNIQKIQQNSNDIIRMVDQLGTPTDSSDLRDRLQQRQHLTNQIAKETAGKLKEIKALPAAYPASEQRHRKTQLDKLVTEFTDVLNNFQTIQRDAAKKEKETLARVRAESAAQDPSGGPLVDLQGGLQAQEQAQISQQEAEEIEDRQAAIQQLEADIVDVNMIFKDLGAMVHEQGDIIDSIEANVESAADNVESGNQQLVKARKSASSARKKKFICAIIILIAIVALILIIYFSVRGS